ncbi:MAG: hypothetical protein KJ793_02845, partial [Candidatus Omnitrophica bacterium]|nr:hypothetical protein [Candidatus Omnitrophota bacterium]
MDKAGLRLAVREDESLESVIKDVLNQAEDRFMKAVNGKLRGIAGIKSGYDTSWASRIFVYLSLGYNWQDAEQSLPLSLVIRINIWDGAKDIKQELKNKEKEKYESWKVVINRILEEEVKDAKANGNEWDKAAISRIQKSFNELIGWLEDTSKNAQRNGQGNASRAGDKQQDSFNPEPAKDSIKEHKSDKDIESKIRSKIKSILKAEKEVKALEKEANPEIPTADMSWRQIKDIAERRPQGEQTQEFVSMVVEAILENKMRYNLTQSLEMGKFLMNYVDNWPGDWTTKKAIDQLQNKFTRQISDKEVLKKFRDELSQVRSRKVDRWFAEMMHRKQVIDAILKQEKIHDREYSALKEEQTEINNRINRLIAREDITPPEIKGPIEKRIPQIYDSKDKEEKFSYLKIEKFEKTISKLKLSAYAKALDEVEKIHAGYIALVNHAYWEEKRITFAERVALYEELRQKKEELITHLDNKQRSVSEANEGALESLKEIATQKNREEARRELEEQIEELNKSDLVEILEKKSAEVIKFMNVDEPSFLFFKTDSVFENAVEEVVKTIGREASFVSIRNALYKELLSSEHLDDLIEEIQIGEGSIRKIMRDIPQISSDDIKNVIDTLFKNRIYLVNADEALDAIEDRLKEKSLSEAEVEKIISDLKEKIAKEKIAEFINMVMERFRIAIKTREVTLDMLNELMQPDRLKDTNWVPRYL